MKNIRENLLCDDQTLQVRCWKRTLSLLQEPSYAHWHKMTEIVFNGSGIQQIGTAFFTMEPGQLAVIGSNQVHAFFARPQRQETEIFVLQFDAEQILKQLDTHGKFAEDWISGRLFFGRSIPATPRMAALLLEIYEEMQGRRDGFRELVKADILSLMVLLYRASPEFLTMKDLRDFRQEGTSRLSAVFDLIAEHFPEEALTLERAAGAAGLSVPHFCRLFKAATGMGFHGYLIHYRVSCARQMLEQGKSISDTAYACGFGDASALYRNFRKICGFSPSRMKKQGNTRKK